MSLVIPEVLHCPPSNTPPAHTLVIARSNVMLFSLKVVLPLWAVVMVMGHGAIASDDHDPLEAVVQQLAQKVEQLEARVDARMTGFETELREYHFMVIVS